MLLYYTSYSYLYHKVKKIRVRVWKNIKWKRFFFLYTLLFSKIYRPNLILKYKIYLHVNTYYIIYIHLKLHQINIFHIGISWYQPILPNGWIFLNVGTMPKILRYLKKLIKVSTLLSNLRFLASSRRLEESTKLCVGWILYIDTKWIKMLFIGVSNYHDTLGNTYKFEQFCYCCVNADHLLMLTIDFLRKTFLIFYLKSL